MPLDGMREEENSSPFAEFRIIDGTLTAPVSGNTAMFTRSEAPALASLPTAFNWGLLGLRCNFTAPPHPTLVQNTLNRNGFQQMCAGGDVNLSGMKVFTTLMLNAYRKRRNEVKLLTGNVEDLKNENVKAKDQLHNLNAMLSVERKRNDNLRLQLEGALDEFNQKRESCELLDASELNMLKNKALLQQQISKKDKDIDGLNAVVRATNSELFKSIAKQRELETSMTKQQRRIKQLEIHRNELLAEVSMVTNDAMEKEHFFRRELQRKEAGICVTEEENDRLKHQLGLMDEYNKQLARFSLMERQFKAEVDELQSQVAALKEKLAGSVGGRMKALWQQSVGFQKTALYVIHLLLYYTLPAMPSPKFRVIPFLFRLQKAREFLQR